ncbi:glycosyltransferase family 4 protein [Clostridium sp. D43t1_170807_H7]|uniref:glycosyltransferase family 4 protein n=1 Tax=Clostridium sp. D43t1_170807_H7 TaxID=2787140 RepID=UPI001897E9F8|nr:glycosyltransferase family 4 protein [Clostridium sp. D43t1_170807_H7]
MKKILYVTTVSSTINVFLIPHIKRLIEKGNKVEIACNIDQPISNELIDYGVKLHMVDFSRNPLSLNNIRAYKQIKEIQKKNKYQIINVHTPIASFITRLALRSYKVKMIYTCHGFHFYKGSSILNWILYYPMEKIAGRFTDTIITINTEDLKIAKTFKLRKNGKIRLMHGVGIEPNRYRVENFNKEEYRLKLGIDKDDFIILMLAELNKNKNHRQLINAIEILSKKYSNIKVLCAGKGELKDRLEKIVEEKGLSKTISFLGFRSDVKELINISDCIALFSKREGLGKCILEGMIVGIPVIATNTRGPRELIQDGDNGYLVQVGNIKETANKIEKIYLNKEIREKFISQSFSRCQKYYIKNVLNEIEEYC